MAKFNMGDVVGLGDQSYIFVRYDEDYNGTHPDSPAAFLEGIGNNGIWERDERIPWQYVESGNCKFVWNYVKDYELIKPKKSIMNTISIVAKKLLDADTQTLIKAGYLDSELAPTQKAKDNIEALAFEAHKAELVALAKAELEEAKK